MCFDMTYKVTPGSFDSMGALVKGKKICFTYECNTRESTYLHLYDIHTKKRIERIEIPQSYCKGRLCSVSLECDQPYDILYHYEIHGKKFTDPYATGIVGREKWNDTSRAHHSYKVYSSITKKNFNWRGDRSPRIQDQDLVMYRLNLRGFTMGDKALPEEKKGNYRGFMQRLERLRGLGVNLLEFQPLYEFEEILHKIVGQTIANGLHRENKDLPYGVNLWGYSKGSYFAPKASYFGGTDPQVHMKEMIRAIHSKGMEIIMELWFSPDTSHNLILDSLKFWHEEYHVDGFRLIGQDLPLKRIAEEAVLADVRIFCDYFPEDILSRENKTFRHLYLQNDAFLYPLRKLQNHKDGSIIEFANMMKRQNSSYGFVNFAASSDGFTLADVYSYSEKHNYENGEENRDGQNYNFSHNYGVEGETNSRNVMNERLLHIRSALAAVVLSQGIPMIQAGDTFGNTQFGNNNSYCQDNETGWVLLSRKRVYRDLNRYVAKLLAFRKEHPILRLQDPMQMADYRHISYPDLSYHGREPWTVWLSDDRKSIGMLYCGAYGEPGRKDADDVMVLYNFYFEDETFQLPKARKGRGWYYITSTQNADWNDEGELLSDQSSMNVHGGAVTILLGKKLPEEVRKVKDE